VDRHTAPRYQQVDRLEVFRLCKTRRLVVDECLGITERRTEPGVISQRADTTVDIDRGIDFGIAGVGNSNFLIARAIGGEGTSATSPRSFARSP
jgi:hypothetical protein